MVWGVRVLEVSTHCLRAHFWSPRAVVLAERVLGTALASRVGLKRASEIPMLREAH